MALAGEFVALLIRHGIADSLAEYFLKETFLVISLLLSFFDASAECAHYLILKAGNGDGDFLSIGRKNFRVLSL